MVSIIKEEPLKAATPFRVFRLPVSVFSRSQWLFAPRSNPLFRFTHMEIYGRLYQKSINDNNFKIKTEKTILGNMCEI